MEKEAGGVVLLDACDGVLTITLNRPAKRNAVDRAVAEAVSAALDRLEDDDALRVGVLTGAGGTFCAGLDLDAFARGEAARSASRGFAGIVERPPAKPLIGAVEGWALGGGFEILLCCDLLVASSTAVLGLPEVKRGLVARGGGALRLTQHLPRGRALELLLTGEPINAADAHAYGLVNRLAEPGEALRVARELARAISANAPLAVSAAKRIVTEAPGWGPDEAFRRQGEILAPVFDSADAREGALAFKEKRPPVWRGR
ncbi:crotonase/enoyl-CoA hydratase family protein [Actinomadura chibensis]|uniref:Crotonase/enoyl-CoA hydratase family protein n=1 Tax=Actinomadura chibensis TaxID=392828 RepID=A0A5D0NDM5_9ACTN|nr:crotonase/enoyl-CoA hydratase family protein [Actinomadura chibensis]TYB42423.1 crotonase/enoyl-CoA hydratase family protein [Actinomadura chibensis]